MCHTFFISAQTVTSYLLSFLIKAPSVPDLSSVADVQGILSFTDQRFFERFVLSFLFFGSAQAVISLVPPSLSTALLGAQHYKGV